MRGKAGLLIGTVAALASFPALADSLRFTGQLANDVSLSDKPSNGKGTAALVLDTATKTVVWTIDYAGLSGPAALVQCGAMDSPSGPTIEVTANLANPIKGSKTLNDGEVAALKSGHWICLVGTNDDEAELGGELHQQ